MTTPTSTGVDARQTGQQPAPEVSTPFQKELDARGLNCPLPILRTKKALSDMLSGHVLRVVATDAGATRDFEAFARQTRNALVKTEQHGDELIFYLKKR